MSGARVLVVDDEPQILRALQIKLGNAGYLVDAAATAKDALAQAAMRPPDAVILDLLLPDGSGTEVCRELLARLRAALRRTAPSGEPVIEVGELRLDRDKRTVTMAGTPVALTPTEWDLLRLLAENEGKLLTHPAILRAIWGPAYREESNYLHVYVSHLRRKIEPDPARPRYLLNQPGVGYRLVSPS